ncbi:KIR-like protein [Plasmodium coatneyi]|uniref:KIR-like protein n=1 Tax=Plasmodium coatneyi TaxID=208452 RepID=A0A1B1DWI9_9APIC|nr:KIR-like protein [Plasmodium coatneyi]ANQ07128.1 KIR-like protein [Plasmodium coatneyi]
MATTNCWWEGSSQSRYKELEKAAKDNNTCKGCKESRKSVLEAAVQDYKGVEKEVPNMMNAWCYVNTRDEKDKPIYCDLFYYWLGEILFREVKKDEFARREKMKTIYEKLQDWKKIDNCTRTLPKVTPEEFGRLKALYHYTQDYSQLENKINTEGDPCAEEYKKFLKEANDTYIERDDRCKRPNANTDEYCKEIGKIISGAGETLKDPSEILPELKKKLTPLESEEPKNVTVETHSGQKGTSGATTGAVGKYIPIDGGKSSTSRKNKGKGVRM